VTAQRRILAAIWLVVAGLPLGVLALELLRHPAAWRVWTEWHRVFLLAKNSFLLVFAVCLIGLPLGTAAAFLLYRTDLPGRRWLRRIVILALFIPLPVLVSAWQATLGSGGWWTAPGWSTSDPNDPDVAPSGIAWKPWARGMPAAIWVHLCASLPWFIWLAGIGLTHVERPLEEDALIHGGLWRAIGSATLPRAAPALLAATAWVGLLTVNEITVTDMMQVPTLAEEVYVQFARPDPPQPGEQGRDVLARALAVAVPPSLLFGVAIAWCWRRWEDRLPPLFVAREEFILVRLGQWRWLGLALILGLLLILVGIPVASLLWRTGHTPSAAEWSAHRSSASLRHVWNSQSLFVGQSLANAIALGALVALAVGWACWLARERRWLRDMLFGTAILLVALPGPALGIALKDTIAILIDAESAVLRSRTGPLFRVLYSGPSLAPVDWAIGLRLFPCALALLWPVVRSIPRELFEQARLDGASPWHEWRLVVWPESARVIGLAATAVAALALGEISASKLVETPGGQSFAHEVFQQMHYGVDNHLAAMCLLLLSAVAALGAAGLMVEYLWRKMRRN